MEMLKVAGNSGPFLVQNARLLTKYIFKECCILRSCSKSYLKTCNICAEERCKLSTTSATLTFVTQLVIENIRFYFDL